MAAFLTRDDAHDQPGRCLELAPASCGNLNPTLVFLLVLTAKDDPRKKDRQCPLETNDAGGCGTGFGRRMIITPDRASSYPRQSPPVEGPSAGRLFPSDRGPMSAWHRPLLQGPRTRVRRAPATSFWT